MFISDASIIHNGIYLSGAENYTAYIPLSFVTVENTAKVVRRLDGTTFTMEVFTFLPEGPIIQVQPSMKSEFEKIAIDFPNRNIKSFYMAKVKAHKNLSAALKRMDGKVNEVITTKSRRKTRRGQRSKRAEKSAENGTELESF